MRLKTLLCGTLAGLMVLCCAIDADAQKRSTGKRTTSSKPAAKTATAAKPTGPTIAPDYLVDRSYSLYYKYTKENMYLYGDVHFDDNNKLTIKYGASKKYGDTVWEGNWSISGNKVTIRSGKTTFSLSSKDGGITFEGTVTKTGDGAYPAQMLSQNCRNLTDRSNSESWFKALKDGEYETWIRYYVAKDNFFMADPVKVKFVEDEEDPDQGTVKISGEGSFMEFLGSLKSVYEFGEDGLTIHFQDYTELDDYCTSAYSEKCGGWFWVKLGPKQIPGKGLGIVLLDFYHK